MDSYVVLSESDFGPISLWNKMDKINIITRVKTIQAENGQLYVSCSSYSGLLADCKVEVCIDEHESRPLANFPDCHVIRTRVCLTICSDMTLRRRVDDCFLQSVYGFDVSADIPLRDGTYERVVFMNVTPSRIDLGGEWCFEVNDQGIVKRILEV